jgi:hypothetical protein
MSIHVDEIDQSEWIEKYKPEMNGEDFVDIGYEDPRIQTHPKHIWTKLSVDCSCDGPDEDEVTQEVHDAFWDNHMQDCPIYEEPDIFSGARWVNRMEYYYCEVAFEDNEDIGVS